MMYFTKHIAVFCSSMLRFFSRKEMEKAVISLAASMCEKNYAILAWYLQ